MWNSGDLVGLQWGDADSAIGLRRWYGEMTECWMTAEPFTRRRLILRTHRWIAERVLEPIVEDEEPRGGDLEAHGLLAQALMRLIPRWELCLWRRWVRLALADLRQALARDPAQRSEAWARWLFLIPYSIPVPPDAAEVGRLRRSEDWLPRRRAARERPLMHLPCAPHRPGRPYQTSETRHHAAFIEDAPSEESGMADWWTGLEGEILDCLARAGVTTPAEIGRRLGIPEDDAASVLTILVRDGRVRLRLVELAGRKPDVDQLDTTPPLEPA